MKNLSKIVLTAAIMVFFAINVNAQTNETASQAAEKQKAASSTSGNFVDKDNNGVCDNFGTRAGNGRGANFVDKNNDGVCDNRANVGNKSGNQCKNGQGKQYRNGQGNQCRNGNGSGRGRGNCSKR